MTADERRAIAFVALLLVLAAGARLVRRDPPVEWPGDAAAIADSLEAAARARLEEAERRSRPLEPGERIDPNSAPEEELDRLPGVGPGLARRIVAAREAGGPFRSLEDLMRVQGIGPSTLRRLAPHLELPSGGPARPGPGAPALLEFPPGGADTRDRVAGALEPRDRAGRAGAGRIRTERPGSQPRGFAPAHGPIDLNRATAAELEALPGIGPALAARIVAYRDSAGGFRDIGELARVRGIGAATLERLRPLVYVRP